MPHPTEVPSEIVSKWQEIVDLLAEIIHVPSALIMRVEPPNIKVFVSSESEKNPYEPNELASLNTGLYCETVMNTRQPLLVPDARNDEAWKSNPDIKLGMVSYLGVPVIWPDGEIFGTICVLDNKGNAYSELYLRLLLQWREVVQADLRWLAALQGELRESEKRYREVQMELAHANRLAIVGQLTASIAHEVKQPVAATIANASAGLRWLDGPAPNLEEVRQALTRIVKDGNRSAEVIDRIRALIKRAPPRRDSLEMNGAIREVIELTRGEALRNGVSVQVELADGLPLVQGDRVELQQVLLNLVVNAVEAMTGTSEGTRRLVINSGNAETGGVCVSVVDSGPGLAPGAIDRLFEAFYTTKPGGLGLGLCICRSIIEAHGGQLWASANVTRGVTFQFTVPSHSEADISPRCRIDY
jgi:signal transduction histidine kinase